MNDHITLTVGQRDSSYVLVLDKIRGRGKYECYHSFTPKRYGSEALGSIVFHQFVKNEGNKNFSVDLVAARRSSIALRDSMRDMDDECTDFNSEIMPLDPKDADYLRNCVKLEYKDAKI